MSVFRRGGHAGGSEASMTRRPVPPEQPASSGPAAGIAPPPWARNPEWQEPAPPALPQRKAVPSREETPDGTSPEQPVSRRLPTVGELAEQVAQEIPVITRPASPPVTGGLHCSPDFHLPRFPSDAALAALPKVAYPRPASLPGDYAGAMQVVSVLTGTVTPHVWHRPAVEVTVTSDEEIAGWERHRYADQMRRLDAANLAVAGVRS
jgi:hypothetical protein